MPSNTSRTAKTAAAKAAKAAEAEAAQAAIAAAGIIPVPPLTDTAPAIIPAETPATDAPAPEALAETALTRAEQIARERAYASLAVHFFDANRASVPVKSFAAFKRSYNAGLGALRVDKPSERQAAALAVACIASGQPIADGATFPRKFTIADRGQFAIENGCTSDIHSCGFAKYDPRTESFTLRSEKTLSDGTVIPGARQIIATLLGAKSGAAELPGLN